MHNADRPSGSRPLESWVESWLRALRELGAATPERRATVLEDIQAGSQPTLTYYALLGISELIAGFALLIDSDVTLIMHVAAPLMTPISASRLAHARRSAPAAHPLIAEFQAFVVWRCASPGCRSRSRSPGLLAQTR
jgi:hypothetical protein